jgi:peptidoglycan hydrolase-like protein with peptidoglycan-binding domain
MTDPWPVLRRGAEGLNVKAVQHLLRCAPRADWKQLAADADFQEKTEQAVREFQQWLHIHVDGVVGEQTWKRLTNGQAISCTVEQGDRGDGVGAAQSELLKNEELKTMSQIDREFGPVTDMAVRHFQVRMKLHVDGKVTRPVWESLIRNDNPG